MRPVDLKFQPQTCVHILQDVASEELMLLPAELETARRRVSRLQPKVMDLIGSCLKRRISASYWV
jgi:hypothetical protein